jgi:alkylation response protein AidB-like acyl-CoA dehydrogenase
MFVGYLQQDWSAEAFVQPDVCFAGSGRPNGIATIVEDGFRVSGQWDYATGAPHATIFTANAVVYNNGLPLLTEDGTPTILSFCFKREEVKIIENWATMGMKATAGNSFEVENIWVPSNRTFTIDAQHCILPNPLYQYPFLSFAELTTAVNTLGMGMHFLEECQEIFSQKIAKQPENKDLKAMLLNESNLIYEQRKAFYEIAQASWQECITTGELSATTMAQISDTCKTMVRKIRKMANQLYPYCGMVAAITDTRINRIWRDLFTASQHSLLL